MAQGNKNKAKANLPPQVKQKTNKKNSAFQKRKRAPVQKKMVGKLKIQEAITKSVNQKNETEMKKRAISTGQTLSKAQLAVQQHHQKKEDKKDT